MIQDAAQEILPSPSELISAPWHLLRTGFRSGEFNMYTDEHLARQLAFGEGMQVIRFFGWTPPAISLGYNQRRVDIDERACRENGIDIVRRPTGGRAILHAEEVTYSVVMYAAGRSVQGIYQLISMALVRGLSLLGAEVEFANTQPNFTQLYRQQTSIPCFASSSRFEIQYKGKKLVGSAQRRFAGSNGDDVVLQHGSILLGDAHKRLSNLLTTSADVQKVILKDLEEKTTELDSILGRKPSFEEVADALQRGFEHEWNIHFIEGTLSE